VWLTSLSSLRANDFDHVDHEQAGCVKVFFEIHSGRNKSSIDRDKK